MQITKTNQAAFTSLTKLKSTNPKILNKLEDMDFGFWRKSADLDCRYYQVATSTRDKDGFFHGILLDENDVKNYPPLVSAKRIKEIAISKLEDLKKIPVLEKYYPEIEKLYNS